MLQKCDRDDDNLVTRSAQPKHDNNESNNVCHSNHAEYDNSVGSLCKVPSHQRGLRLFQNYGGNHRDRSDHHYHQPVTVIKIKLSLRRPEMTRI